MQREADVANGRVFDIGVSTPTAAGMAAQTAFASNSRGQNGVLAANDTNNSKTATDAGKGYGGGSVTEFEGRLRSAARNEKGGPAREVRYDGKLTSAGDGAAQTSIDPTRDYEKNPAVFELLFGPKAIKEIATADARFGREVGNLYLQLLVHHEIGHAVAASSNRYLGATEAQRDEIHAELYRENAAYASGTLGLPKVFADGLLARAAALSGAAR